MTDSLKTTAAAALRLRAEPVTPEHHIVAHNLRALFHPREPEELPQDPAIGAPRLFQD